MLDVVPSPKSHAQLAIPALDDPFAEKDTEEPEHIFVLEVLVNDIVGLGCTNISISSKSVIELLLTSNLKV